MHKPRHTLKPTCTLVHQNMQIIRKKHTHLDKRSKINTIPQEQMIYSLDSCENKGKTLW